MYCPQPSPGVPGRGGELQNLFLLMRAHMISTYREEPSWALDKWQAAAASVVHPKRLVIAGPGSGKTRVLVEAVRLAAGRHGAGKCAALAFTNAAAGELKARLSEAGVEGLGFVGTVHSFWYRWARQFLGRSPAVLDEASAAALREQVAGELKAKLDHKLCEDWDVGLCTTAKTRTKSELVAMAYQSRLQEEGLLDFAGVEHFGQLGYRSAVDNGPWPFRFLAWDEVQDAAPTDLFPLIRGVRGWEELVLVGDPDQSVYGFRGASSQTVSDLARHPGWNLSTLHMNYRCPSKVAEAAGRLIFHNSGRVQLRTTAAKTGGLLEVVAFENEQHELQSVAALAAKALKAGQSVAVLCRTNRQAQQFAGDLGPLAVTDSPDETEAKLGAVLRAMANPTSDWAVCDALGYAVGKDAATALLQEAREEMLGLNDYASRKGCPGTPFMDVPLRWVDLYPTLVQWGVSDRGLAKVQAAVGAMGEGWTMGDLAAAVAKAETPEAGEGVVVTTIHRAKGREWDVVFVPGLEEPEVRKLGDKEESRRLLYVALTRAKREAVLSWAKRRAGWGGVEKATFPSLFLGEL